MVCLRNININTLHKGDDDDNNNYYYYSYYYYFWKHLLPKCQDFAATEIQTRDSRIPDVQNWNDANWSPNRKSYHNLSHIILLCNNNYYLYKSDDLSLCHTQPTCSVCFLFNTCFIFTQCWVPVDLVSLSNLSRVTKYKRSYPSANNKCRPYFCVSQLIYCFRQTGIFYHCQVHVDKKFRTT